MHHIKAYESSEQKQYTRINGFQMRDLEGGDPVGDILDPNCFPYDNSNLPYSLKNYVWFYPASRATMSGFLRPNPYRAIRVSGRGATNPVSARSAAKHLALLAGAGPNGGIPPALPFYAMGAVVSRPGEEERFVIKAWPSAKDRDKEFGRMTRAVTGGDLETHMIMAARSMDHTPWPTAPGWVNDVAWLVFLDDDWVLLGIVPAGGQGKFFKCDGLAGVAQALADSTQG